MASVIPNSFKGRLMGDTTQIATAINLATDTIKLMLVTSSYTPDIDADVFIDDVSANEVAVTSATITARYGVVYKDTGTPATSPIIAVIDFGSNQTSTAGTFALAFAAEGILNLV